MSARRRPASDPRRRLLEAMAVMGAPLPAGGYSAFTCYDTKTPQGKALAGARLLRELEQAGFVTRVGKSTRYVITLKGRRAANGFGLCDECTSASTAGEGAA